MTDPNLIRLLLEVVLIAGIAAVAVGWVIRRSLASNASVRQAAEAEVHAWRQSVEDDLRTRQASVEKDSERLREREDQLDSKRGALEEREAVIAARAEEVKLMGEQVKTHLSKAEGELARVSGLTPDTAKAELMERLQKTHLEEIQNRLRELEVEATTEVESKARRAMLKIMERINTSFVTEATVAVVTLPNEEMKGRLIGREGRNIRAFEQVTGVDLIIDETPEAVVISSFDPIRRETARLALMNLMLDGRIHPGRIEELFEQAQTELERTVQESGEKAAALAGVSGLPTKVIETMGKLRFRTSYSQNVLDHSVEVAQLCAMLASELGLNADFARRAGFLHDIGKALPPDWEGPHALAGMEFLRQFQFKESLLNAVGAHHREIEPLSPEAELLIIADSMSASRPGARRENLDNYVKRLKNLEELANAFEGVERSFAVQAGRELRVVVVPDRLSDAQAAKLAKDLVARIEAELDYPGQIKVTVIRETRIQEIAK